MCTCRPRNPFSAEKTRRPKLTAYSSVRESGQTRQLSHIAKQYEYIMKRLINSSTVSFFLCLSILISLSVCLESFNALTCDEEEQYCIAWPEALLPNGVNPDGKPVEAPEDCKDRVDQCPYFSELGECTNNPGIVHDYIWTCPLYHTCMHTYLLSCLLVIRLHQVG